MGLERAHETEADAVERPAERAEHSSWSEVIDRFRGVEAPASDVERPPLRALEVTPPEIYPALEAYRLDPESQLAAREVGRAMADVMSPEQWALADRDERQRLTDALAREVRRITRVDSGPPLTHQSDEDFGLTLDKQVAYHPALLDEPDCHRLVDTVAHEYRHVWQQEVEDGDQRHPEGPAGRAAFAQAHHDYHDDLVTGRYFFNRLELDSRKFAWHAWHSFLSHQEHR